jgi:hypothetical protein
MLLEPPTDTLPRYRGSVANRAWRSPFAPDVFRRGVTLDGGLDSGRMRSLIGGVCIKPGIATIKGSHNPKSEARCHAPVSRPEGTASAQGLQLPLYSQTQETCDDYDHDHHTDDVKNIHCVLLRVRDANPLEGGQICDWVHPGSFCHGCKALLEQSCLRRLT